MTITHKTLAIVGIAYFLLISTLVAVSKFSVLSGFVDIEAENARIDGIRVMNEINDDMATLSATVGDWAPWDETYQFIQDLNDVYITGNITYGTFTNNRIDFIVFINDSGQIVFSKSTDPATGKMESTPAGLKADILAIPDLTVHKTQAASLTGILKTGQRIALVSSYPILKSDFTGPAHGSLVMGRYLDDKELQRINKTTRLSIQMYNWTDPLLPEDCRTAQSYLSQASPIHITPLGENRIATYLLLADFSGSPAVLLKVTADRKIYRTGLKTWWYYVVSMAAIGLFFTILIMSVLNRIVLAPLNLLNRNVQSIRNARNFYARLPAGTSADELGQLAVEINKMLEELSISGKRISEQSYQSGLSEMASDMLHQIRNSLSPIAGNMDLMEEDLHKAGFLSFDRALDELEAGTLSKTRQDDLLRFVRMASTKLKNLLTNIQKHLNNAREPIGDIENILQEYQLTAGILPQIGSINLMELVEDALEKSEPGEGRSGRVILDPGLSEIGPVLGNRVSMLNVVKTLILTFAHLTHTADDSENNIHITAEETSGEDQVMVHLSIIDKGKGLDSGITDRVFERGFLSRQECGADTSLHWCANVINAMGGSLYAGDRGKNQGTGFHLFLPRAASAHDFEENNIDGN